MSTPGPGDTVAIHFTGRLEDGRVFATSEEPSGPVEVTLGDGTLIPQLERELAAMEPGDERSVTIPPEHAYGERRPELCVEVDRARLPGSVPPEVGRKLRVATKSGDSTIATIVDIDDEQVLIDANHPLAGRTLTFELKLVDVRDDPKPRIAKEGSLDL